MANWLLCDDCLAIHPIESGDSDDWPERCPSCEQTLWVPSSHDTRGEAESARHQLIEEK